MMCPVCKRDLAPTLSICLTCGAMIHDTVREELETKISKTGPPRPIMTVKPMSAPPPVARGEQIDMFGQTTEAAPPKTTIPNSPTPATEATFSTSPRPSTEVAPPTFTNTATPAAEVPPPTFTISNSPTQSAEIAPPKFAIPKAPTPTAEAATPKIATPNSITPPPSTIAPPPRTIAQRPMTPPAAATPAPKPIAARFDTADLGVKHTSPTLVEFQTKKATVPEWRLQLQNSVRQKVGGNRRDTTPNETQQSQPRTTSGANALKVEFIEDDQPAKHDDPRVASALKRIEQSRRTFSNQPILEQPVNVGKAPPPPPRNYPFNVVARSNEPPKRPEGQRATVNASPKPMLVSPLKIEKRGYDTNKLPPLAKSAEPIQTVQLRTEAPKIEADEARERWEQLDVNEMSILQAEPETDEIEDLAPFSMRVGAGIFDLIVGVFTTLIILSPFIVSGGTWMTVSGGLAIAAAVAIVMFVYLTGSIAFAGRTVGMRLFSLELVDIEENAYPTLHQAAVNSAVYLLSMALFGLGFLTVFFNEERRAAHDILSGTILVREY